MTSVYKEVAAVVRAHLTLEENSNVIILVHIGLIAIFQGYIIAGIELHLVRAEQVLSTGILAVVVLVRADYTIFKLDVVDHAGIDESSIG